MFKSWLIATEDLILKMYILKGKDRHRNINLILDKIYLILTFHTSAINLNRLFFVLQINVNYKRKFVWSLFSAISTAYKGVAEIKRGHGNVQYDTRPKSENTTDIEEFRDMIFEDGCTKVSKVLKS